MTDLSPGPLDQRCVATLGTARCFLDQGHSGSHVSDARGAVWTDDDVALHKSTGEYIGVLIRERDEARAKLAEALATLERLGLP